MASPTSTTTTTSNYDTLNRPTSELIQVYVYTAIAVYNSIELFILIFTTFKEWKWRSLYFDSMLAATFGIIPYNIGFWLEYFRLAPFWLAMTLSSIGWTLMVTGQSLVLYSRLNLVFTSDYRSDWILKAVKWMIIIDGVIFHTSITIIQYGTRYGPRQQQFQTAIYYGERIQMTGFCIQEFIISALYVWKTLDILKVISRKQGARQVILGLLFVNVLIILMDLVLLTLEYTNFTFLERVWKPFVYSVKLKLEFVILGKLVELVQSKSRDLSATLMDFTDVASRTVSGASYPDIPTPALKQAPKWAMDPEGGGGGEGEALHIENVSNIDTKVTNPRRLQPRLRNSNDSMDIDEIMDDSSNRETEKSGI